MPLLVLLLLIHACKRSNAGRMNACTLELHLSTVLTDCSRKCALKMILMSQLKERIVGKRIFLALQVYFSSASTGIAHCPHGRICERNVHLGLYSAVEVVSCTAVCPCTSK